MSALRARVLTPWRFLPDLTADGRLLFLTCGLRQFAFGFLAVVLGLYLGALGLDTGTIGGIFTAALAGGAVMTILLTAYADRLGRRRVLIAGAALMSLAGAVFALSGNALWLGAAAVLGSISPSGKEVGPFLSLEQAILPQTTPPEHRTGLFAAYNLVGSFAGALGALLVAVPDALGLDPLVGYRGLVWAYAGAGLALMWLFSRLSPAVEVRSSARRGKASGRTGAGEAVRPTGVRLPTVGVHRSRGIVLKLAALFALDAFAGAFVVQALVALWFNLRYGADAAALGAIFFGTNLLSALSFLAAAPIARRIGLLNTMVFTHLPSNVLLLLVPLMPSLELAVLALLARHLLSQLDVPTRQSYTMAVVEPDERSAAAGITSVARNAAAAAGPAFAGATLAVPAAGIPFLLAGSLKIVYDLAILLVFRNVRPPEERRRTVDRGAISRQLSAVRRRRAEG